LPKIHRLKEKEYELKQDSFYYDIDYDAKRDILDKVIDEEVQLYALYNLGWKKKEELFLNEEQQMKLIKEISAKVYVNRLTPAVMSVLQYYYVFTTEEELEKIVLDRVSLAVLDLSLGTNKPVIDINF
jgi:hypothetical protein